MVVYQLGGGILSLFSPKLHCYKDVTLIDGKMYLFGMDKILTFPYSVINDIPCSGGIPMTAEKRGLIVFQNYKNENVHFVMRGCAL